MNMKGHTVYTVWIWKGILLQSTNMKAYERAYSLYSMNMKGYTSTKYEYESVYCL